LEFSHDFLLENEFFSTLLTSITIPQGITSIGPSTFAYSSLTNVTIPGSVTNIGYNAFYSCHNLNGVFFLGNAPTAGWSVFSWDANVTAYYLPGTTGWDSFAASTGIPTALWNPQVQTSDGSFGIQSNRFGFKITGATNIPIVVEACTNLGSAWTLLQTCTVTNGSIFFSDSQWSDYPGRYYRLRSP
jgi:hypothetical protein